jgi:hypothetical protein
MADDGIRPGLKAFYATQKADAELGAQRQAQKQQSALLAAAPELAQLAKSGDVKGAFARLIQIKPELAQEPFAKMFEVNPEFQGQQVKARQAGELESQAAYGSTPRQLLDAKNQYDLLSEKMRLEMKTKEELAKGPKLTPGEEAVDKDFGKEYSDFALKGGSASVEAKLAPLEEAVLALESDTSLTGPVRGIVPDVLRKITNPKAIEVKQAVEKGVQESLRQVLGAQFTEKEGESLLRRTFDPQLPPLVVAKRVRNVVQQLREAAKAKQAAGDYFKENGTMKGFNAKPFSVDSIDPNAGIKLDSSERQALIEQIKAKRGKKN